MKKRTKTGFIALIVLFAVAVIILMKNRSPINVTLVGVIQNTKSMSEVLLICDSRSFKEADLACNQEIHASNDEVNNLCKLRLELNMTSFNNKCLRYYKLVDRIRQSQDNLSDFLKKTPHDHLINESMNPAHMTGLKELLKNCEDPAQRPACMLETSAFFIDGWFKEAHVDYLYEEQEIKVFIEKHPNFEEDISTCKDFQAVDKCKVLNEFMKLHYESILNYLSNTQGQNVILIMKQEHLNYVSCKDLDKIRYNCKDLVL